MRWKIVLEGTDEFGSAHRSELTIDKDLERLSAGEIGFSVEEGMAIMAHLQQVVVNQQCDAYVLTSQIADHIVRWRDAGNSEMAQVGTNVRSLKWKLWHGQTDQALDQLKRTTSDSAKLRERGNLSATRLLHLAHSLLSYVRSNKSAIVNYGACYRSGRCIATALTESGVNSLVARRMVKKQQMLEWALWGGQLGE